MQCYLPAYILLEDFGSLQGIAEAESSDLELKRRLINVFPLRWFAWEDGGTNLKT